MLEERATEIVQGKRVYRYACTEEVIIGGTIWTRDKYLNVNAPASYLLLNFTDTGVRATGEAPKVKRHARPERYPNLRQYVQDWKEKVK